MTISTDFDELKRLVLSILDNYYLAVRNKDQNEADAVLMELRKFVLLHGVPEEEEVYYPPDVPYSELKVEENDRVSNRNLTKLRKVEMTIRGLVWKALLGINCIRQTEYIRLVELRESSFFDKICRDTYRTFKSDPLFKGRVNEYRLMRVLNSFVHKYDRNYSQGMDILAGCLLFVMPETDALAGMDRLINECLPVYWIKDDDRLGDLAGAYAGAMLVKKILAEVDPDLADRLSKADPYIYCFHAITSILGIAQPFQEVLRLWDFLFCLGLHINVVCVAAQILLKRKEIFKHKLNVVVQEVLGQRKWPRLAARKIIDKTMTLLPIVRQNKELWERICGHTVDAEVAHAITLERKGSTNMK